MTHVTVPSTAVAADGTQFDIIRTGGEAANILMTGHARDPGITRYRPDVRLTRSQSGMSTTQQQAEWAVRVALGQSKVSTYRVLDWRAGPDRVLWRPNQITGVVDPYAGIDDDMLIQGVTYSFGDRGLVTELSVTGRDAFDRINESDRRRQRRGAKTSPYTGPASFVGPNGQVVPIVRVP